MYNPLPTQPPNPQNLTLKNLKNSIKKHRNSIFNKKSYRYQDSTQAGLSYCAGDDHAMDGMIGRARVGSLGIGGPRMGEDQGGHGKVFTSRNQVRTNLKNKGQFIQRLRVRSEQNCRQEDSKNNKSIQLTSRRPPHLNLNPNLSLNIKLIKSQSTASKPQKPPLLLNLNANPNPTSRTRTKSQASQPSHSQSQPSQPPSPTLTLTQRLQRRTRYTQEHRQRKNTLTQQLPFYKNQKLSYISQQQISILRRIPEHLIDIQQIKSDLTVLIGSFQELPANTICLSRHVSQFLRTLIGLLIFYVGYELYIRYSEDHGEMEKYYEIVLCNFYQIYFALRLKVPLVMMEAYLTLIDLAISKQNYTHAQKYSQKCLLASLAYNEKYYQQRCIQKISMCEYYKGNICEATYLHDNNGQVTHQSVKQTKQSYNEQEELQVLFHHLYEIPKFQIEALLADYEERNKSYKAMVVFRSPRIGPQDSFRSKKEQLRIDLRDMERQLEFKSEAEKIRKEINRHEALFTVRNASVQEGEFKLLKRNMMISQENQSSQVLRVHQSLNRAKKINTKALRIKLTTQFVEFLHRLKKKVDKICND